MYCMRILFLSLPEDLQNLKILKNFKRLYRIVFVKMNSVFLFGHKWLVIILLGFYIKIKF